MMIEPPIDQLIKKVSEPRYALTVAVAKRARELQSTDSNYLASSNLTPISLACKELYEGKIVITRE